MNSHDKIKQLLDDNAPIEHIKCSDYKPLSPPLELEPLEREQTINKPVPTTYLWR